MPLLLSTPPTLKLEADPCNTVLFLTSGPAPSALMSRAPASHCDFLPSSLHPGPGCHCCNLNLTDHVTTVTRATRRKCQEGTQCRERDVRGWQEDTMTWGSSGLCFYRKYLEGCGNTAHNEGNRRQNWKTSRKNECLWDIRGFLRTFCVWIFVYCRRINKKKWRPRMFQSYVCFHSVLNTFRKRLF